MATLLFRTFSTFAKPRCFSATDCTHIATIELCWPKVIWTRVCGDKVCFGIVEDKVLKLQALHVAGKCDFRINLTQFCVIIVWAKGCFWFVDGNIKGIEEVFQEGHNDTLAETVAPTFINAVQGLRRKHCSNAWCSGQWGSHLTSY